MAKAGRLGACLVAALLAAAPASMPAAQAVAPIPDDIPIALLLDLSSGQQLYEREGDRRFVPASVTKVMTAFTAFKLIGEGKLSTAMRFQISEQLEEEWSGEGSSMFLLAGDQPTIGELLLGVTTVSGNDASVALAQAATGSLDKWLSLMNSNAAALGMRNTHFGSPNGFPDGGKTFTTAEDLARLGDALITRYPTLYRRFFGHRGMTWNEITQSNHDPVTGRVPGADGLKTGFTNEAGYTFVGSAARDGRRLLIVLAGAPTLQVRDRAAREMLEWGFGEFSSRELLAAGAVVGTVQVQGGAVDAVRVRISKELLASAPRGEEVGPSAQIHYRGPVQAPIAAGERIATLRLAYPGQPPFDVPLEAAEDVPKAGLFRRIGQGLAALFG